MSVTTDWKVIILQRYAGEFPPHAGSAVKLLKSSEDIAFDLSVMGEFHLDEISAFMAVNGYAIEFDDGRPVWALQNRPPKNELPE
ncbi:MAG: hypothetical protein LBP72_06610 [Dysgonamonadaceae bacterium]|jgi:hypothetical protein|nr:hypothetical protein [Dysgonamonadaceae bacterium]